MTPRHAAIAIAIVASGLFSLSSSADSSGVVPAAPGDCAQPIGDFVTQPVYGQAAGVAGPASDHFAPRSVTADLQRLLPLDLTRAAAQTTNEAVGDAVEAADGTVDATTDLAGTTVNGVAGDGNLFQDIRIPETPGGDSLVPDSGPNLGLPPVSSGPLIDSLGLSKP